MANQNLRIDIVEDAAGDGGYKAGIDQERLRTRKLNNIKWSFTAPSNFPAGSTLYLWFYVKDLSGTKMAAPGCMQGNQWNGGIGSAAPDGRIIRGSVKATAIDSFFYEIRFTEANGADHTLMDPEIIVDGGIKRRKAKKNAAKKAAKKTVKKAAKKAAKKASKKTAKKAKRATRSKRKAKKR